MWRERAGRLERTGFRGPAPVARLALFALLAVAVAAVGLAQPATFTENGVQIRISDERPLRGEPVRITVFEDGLPLAAARLVAVYRPNSSTQHREELPPVDSSGLLLWTPTDAGPVTLEVREPGTPVDADQPPVASLTIAVRFGSFPPAGLFIMVLAGILLFGGAAAAFFLLLRPPDHLPAEEPPST